MSEMMAVAQRIQSAQIEHLLSFAQNRLASFACESSAQVECFESLLLDLEDKPEAGGAHLIAMAECMQRIKSEAESLARADIEFFALLLESVLIRLIARNTLLERALVSLLLAAGDHLRLLIAAVAAGDEAGPRFADLDRSRLIGALIPYLESAAESAPLLPEIDPACARFFEFIQAPALVSVSRVHLAQLLTTISHLSELANKAQHQHAEMSPRQLPEIQDLAALSSDAVLLVRRMLSPCEARINPEA